MSDYHKYDWEHRHCYTYADLSHLNRRITELAFKCKDQALQIEALRQTVMRREDELDKRSESIRFMAGMCNRDAELRRGFGR